MKQSDFLAALKLAAASKTLYVSGCFGAPLNAANKRRYSASNAYNARRAAMINAAGADTFGFDCVCLIKGVLWGWSCNASAPYGGAAYSSGGVPDIGENAMIARCSGVSADFSRIVPGAMVWISGHAGVYAGDGLVIECSPAWKNGVQYTACANIGPKAGHASRRWAKWGLLPWVEYEKDEMVENKKFTVNGKSVAIPTIFKDGTNYPELRAIAAALGATVGWNGKTKEITIQTGK